MGPLARPEEIRAYNIGKMRVWKTLCITAPRFHTHPIAMEGDLPLDWAYWQSVDEFYIRLCEKVIVLMLTGWKSSKGVRAEIEIAHALDKPVDFVEAEG